MKKIRTGKMEIRISKNDFLKDTISKIFSNILQEIGLFTTYLSLQKGEDINIEFNVEYSGEGLLGFTV